MISKSLRLVTVVGLATISGACATTQAQPGSGFLSDYEGLEPRSDVVLASVLQRRDEALASAITRLWLPPGEVFGEADAAVSDEERRLILSEVDRQICYELSERFEIADHPDAADGVVRVGVTHIGLTDPAGSAVSAVANFFIPGPIKVRAPGSVGGLGAEAELLMPDGRQAAAIVWRRDAMLVGTDRPSLSRVGDAHQLAEPLGDMIADALAPGDRQTRAIPDPDPCARYGPRFRPEGFLVRLVTGLHQPELSGQRSQAPEDEK